MKNFKVLLFIISLIFTISNINAQEVNYSEDENDYNQFQNNYNEIDYGTDVNTSKVLKQKKQKLSYNVNVGSSFSTGAYGNSLNLYTAPKINYNFTPKLSLSTGLIFMNTTINANNEEGNTNFNQSYLFNSINYQASEKLKISGEILYGMNKSPYDANSNKTKKDYYLRFNAEYKITKNLTFGIQLAKSSNNFYNPFAVPSYNPFYNNNPFSNNMFSPMGNW